MNNFQTYFLILLFIDSFASHKVKKHHHHNGKKRENVANHGNDVLDIPPDKYYNELLKFANLAESFCRIVNVVSDKIIILPEELIKSTPRTLKDLQQFFKGEHAPPRYRDLNLVATRIRDRTKLLVNHEKKVVDRTKNHELVKIIKEAIKSAKDAETKLSHLIKKMAKVGSHEWRGGWSKHQNSWKKKAGYKRKKRHSNERERGKRKKHKRKPILYYL
ncbi:hypothetical protein Ddc_03781 [Ditylenchus destructor]|nr:hypothetical protein Ddc_03781 [Ditylenchus destructor]